MPTAAGADAAGTLSFSADTGELVAVATGLEPEASNEEYGCWVEVDGQRHRLGRMYWVGDVWTWAGPVEGLDNLPPGATFGVSLNTPDGARRAGPHRQPLGAIGPAGPAVVRPAGLHAPAAGRAA